MIDVNCAEIGKFCPRIQSWNLGSFQHSDSLSLISGGEKSLSELSNKLWPKANRPIGRFYLPEFIFETMA